MAAVLATAAKVTKRNLIPFFALACILQAPSVLVFLATGEPEPLVMFLVQLVTGSLTSAVVTYGVIMELQGSRPSTRTCIARGLGQLWRVLGVSLVTTLAIVASMLLLVVPGVIVALMMCVVVPVTVIEGVGIDAAMKRSRELTAGRKGDLWLLLMLWGAVSIAVEVVAIYELDPHAAFVWRAAWSAITSMFLAVTSAVIYTVLRHLREGTRIPEIATALARIRK